MNNSRRQYDIVPPILLLLTLIFFWPQLVLHKSLYWGDIGLYFLPMEQFLRRQLLAGRLPLWNPYILCGTPYVGNPQTWPIYPSSLLLRWMRADQAVDWTIAFHIWLAGYGSYRFLRRALRIRMAPGMFGAIVFMFGGQLISKEQFPNMVQAAAYTPWILLALHRLIEAAFIVPARDAEAVSSERETGNAAAEQNPSTQLIVGRGACLHPTQSTIGVASYRRGGSSSMWLLPTRVASLGLVVGLQLLAAHAQITMLTIYLAAAYLLRECLSYRRMGVPARYPLQYAAPRLLFSLAVAAALAAGLAAAQIIPSCELFEHAWRQRLGLSIVNRFFLPWHQLPNFVLPYLHGYPYRSNYTGRGNFWETCCYIGWLPFVCAVVDVGLSFRSAFRSECRFWTLVFAVGVWTAMGTSGGLFRLVWAALPGFRSFHDPARCLLWASFALSVLGAYGFQTILTWTAANPTHREIGGWKRRRRLIALLLIVLAFTDLCRFGRTIYPLAVSPVTDSLPFREGAGVGSDSSFSPVARGETGMTRGMGSVALVSSDPAIESREARLLAPDSARIWERFTGHRSYRQGVRGYGVLWRETLTPNLPMTEGLLDAFGYEPVNRYDAQTILGAITGAFGPDATDRQRRTAAALAGAYGVRYVATDRVDPPDTVVPGLQTVFDEPALGALGSQNEPNGSVYLSRNLRWQPRARLTTNVLAAASPAMAVREIVASTAQDTGLDLTRTTVIAGPGVSDIADRLSAYDSYAALGGIVPARGGPAMLSKSGTHQRPAYLLLFVRWALAPTPQSKVSTASVGSIGSILPPAAPDVPVLHDDGPDRVVLTAVNHRPAVLVLADTRHPGWHATLDGRPAPILSADGFVRAISLPHPGRHVVIFTYRPNSFYVGLYLTQWTLSVILAIFVAGSYHKTRKNRL